jgi:hypothetical protein
MNVNHLYFLFEENMMKSLNLQTHISLSSPPLYFLFYFFEIPEIFPYKTPTWNMLILRHPVGISRVKYDILSTTYDSFS